MAPSSEVPGLAASSDAMPQEARRRHSGESEVAHGEALELQEIQTVEDNQLNCSMPSASSGDEDRVVTRRTTSRTLSAPANAARSRPSRKGVWGKLSRFWTHHVTLTVPHKSNRDFFALERTFLAYIRTSVVITQQGVLIAQLFRLQSVEALADRFGFHRVGIPLSVTCHSVAILVTFVGAYRFWRQQNAISRGKFHAGGWELNSVGIFVGCIILTTLIISIAIIVEIDTDPTILVERILSIV